MSANTMGIIVTGIIAFNLICMALYFILKATKKTDDSGENHYNGE